MYGDRRDPLAAVARLGVRVADAGDGDLLTAVLSSVMNAVHASGAAVFTPDGQQLDAVGTELTDGVSIPMRVGGHDMGVLRVTARGPRQPYNDADQRLLAALALQVAVVVRALRLTDALEVERDRVLRATRVERDRLRRDLHDGLGPSLSGLALGLQALNDTLPPGGTSASTQLLDRIRAEVATGIEEVRRILDGLRPAALDELGLVTAVRRHTETMSAYVPVQVSAATLPILPPQVETAAYRITQEALTNITRHASARHAHVAMTTTDRSLTLTITDDDGGGGLDTTTEGFGLTSMRHRAETLGGHLTVDSSPAGTTITATLPWEDP